MAGRRVLQVSTSMQTRGGIASFVRMLADTELWARWQTEHLVTHRDGPAPVKIGTFALALARYLRMLVLRRPALVHLHMSSYGSFVRKALLLWLAVARGVPVLVHVHGSEFTTFHDRLPGPLQAIVRATLERSAVVVALGEAWAQRLRVIAPAARVVTIPNAVPVPAAAQRERGPVRVVFLGEIGERKGAFTLLEAWAKATAAAPSGTAQLIMAGDRGVQRARRLIDELGISGSANVSSWLDPAEVAELLAGAEVFVLPSRSEGQPIALLEAMAHGVCVVTTGVGGIPEIVEDGRSGLLVAVDDVAGLAAALQRVLGDEQLRRRMGDAARQRVLDRFSIDTVAGRFDHLYREITGRTS